jgi:hypothetical protein
MGRPATRRSPAILREAIGHADSFRYNRTLAARTEQVTLVYVSRFPGSLYIVANMPAVPAPNLDWQFLLLAIPAFLCFWSFVVANIAIIGGWHRLGKLYRRDDVTFSIADGRPVEKYRWSSLKMGPRFFPTNYGNCITVSLSDEGLGLKVMPLFRPLHPPLLVPWSAVESCALDKELGFFDRAAIQLVGVPHPIRIYGRAGRAVDAYLAAHRSGGN